MCLRICTHWWLWCTGMMIGIGMKRDFFNNLYRCRPTPWWASTRTFLSSLIRVNRSNREIQMEQRRRRWSMIRWKLWYIWRGSDLDEINKWWRRWEGMTEWWRKSVSLGPISGCLSCLSRRTDIDLTDDFQWSTILTSLYNAQLVLLPWRRSDVCVHSVTSQPFQSTSHQA